MRINDTQTSAMMGKQNQAVESKGLKAKEAAELTAQTTTDVSSSTDTFTKSTASASVTYSKESTYVPSENMSSEAIDMAQISHDQTQNFQKMLMNMIGKEFDGISASLFEGITISAEDALAAQESVSEGGEWSAENVAKNIIDMAKALSGGDPEKIELLKEAVVKGFEAAEKAWGGEMPEITSNTFDLVMQGFDDWANESK